jgi:sulfur transfer protein SufE
MDTPKTDALNERLADYEWDEGYGVLLGHARELERENAKLREALAPLASCASEYYAEAPQGRQLETIFVLAQARQAAAAMGWPTHLVRVTEKK